jgi:hypothetical protein
LRGGLGEVRRFANGQEVSQVPQFHGAILSCPKSMAAQQTWYWANSKRTGKTQ